MADAVYCECGGKLTFEPFYPTCLKCGEVYYDPDDVEELARGR